MSLGKVTKKWERSEGLGKSLFPLFARLSKRDADNIYLYIFIGIAESFGSGKMQALQRSHRGLSTTVPARRACISRTRSLLSRQSRSPARVVRCEASRNVGPNANIALLNALVQQASGDQNIAFDSKKRMSRIFL